MGVQRGMKSMLDLSRKLSSVTIAQRRPNSSYMQITSHRTKKINLLPTLSSFDNNSALIQPQKNDVAVLMSEHEQNLLLSSALWATNTKPKIEISDPVKRAPMGRDCDEDANQQVPEPGAIINPKIDPNDQNPTIEKQATKKKQRNLIMRIRKRKVKVHKRKRRWKKYWATWRKQYLYKEKKKEIEFRVRMRAKIHEAQQFDPVKFRDDYLEDFKYQLIPKTYKGQRLPQFRILENLEADRKKELMREKNQIDMFNGEPIIREIDGKKESVKQFIERNSLNIEPLGQKKQSE